MNVRVRSHVASEIVEDRFFGDYTWTIKDGYLHVLTVVEGKADDVYAVYPEGVWDCVSNFEVEAAARRP